MIPSARPEAAEALVERRGGEHAEPPAPADDADAVAVDLRRARPSPARCGGRPRGRRRRGAGPPGWRAPRSRRPRDRRGRGRRRCGAGGARPDRPARPSRRAPEWSWERSRRIGIVLRARPSAPVAPGRTTHRHPDQPVARDPDVRRGRPDRATRCATLRASALLDERLELVLVDDGSRDGTAEVVERLIAELGLDRATGRPAAGEPGQGRGGAGRGAGRRRRARRVFVDADLCVGADDIERCFAALEAGEADVVYGTRAHAHSALDRSQPGYRVVTGRAFNLLLRLLGPHRGARHAVRAQGRDRRRGRRRGGAARHATASRSTWRCWPGPSRAGLRLEGLPVRWSHVEASRVRPGAGRHRDGRRRRCASAAQLDRESGAVARCSRRSAAGVMAADAIDAMARVERDHWWFRGKHRLVLDELRREHVAGPGGRRRRGHRRPARPAGRRRLPGVGMELDRAALAHAARGRGRACRSRGRWPRRCPVRDGARRRGDAPRRARAPRRRRARAARARPGGGSRRAAGGRRARLPVGVERPRRPARAPAPLHARRSCGRRRRPPGSTCGAAPTSTPGSRPWPWLVRRTPLRPAGRASGSAEEASFGSPWINRLAPARHRRRADRARRPRPPVGLSILLVARAPRLATAACHERA